ncbi:MAG: helix-turn-helix transcriptional regulator [Acidobacteria bacterium]|nr:helix-turn-helix transcriptional regulator [Acidobacteriota bacterium]
MKSEETPASVKESELLRDWFARQSKWTTWRAFSDALPLPYSSLKKYVHGRPIRMPEHRARIHRLTGIEAFHPATPAKPDELNATPLAGKDSDNGKARLAIMLRQWLSQRGRFSSIAEMARSIGIAESTLREYFIGRALPSPKNLRILKEVTQLGVLDDISKTQTRRSLEGPQTRFGQDVKSLQDRLDAVQKGFTSLAKDLRFLIKDAGRYSAAYSLEPVDQTPTGRSRRVAEVLAHLRGELEFFKAGSAEDREAFRRAIPGEQLGYVVSLLKALYDEDTFREWLHFTHLDLTEKR